MQRTTHPEGDDGSDWLTAGQIGMDPATGELVAGGVAEQAEQALKNLGFVLDECALLVIARRACGVVRCGVSLLPPR